MKFANDISRVLKRNSTTIMSSTAIAGVVTTSYLSAKATLKARDKIRSFEELELKHDRDRRERLKDDIRLCWRFYVPTMASGAVTIGCIVGTTRVSNKRAAAAQAAFVLSERAYSEYRNKVIEEYGERKDETLRASIAEDRVRSNPPSAIVLSGGVGTLCCELETGRYFLSDMETLRRAENDINARLNNHDSASLDDFYYLIGVQPTANSGDRGWHSDKLLSLEFTPVLTDDNRPCLAFTYNYTRPLYEGLYR